MMDDWQPPLLWFGALAALVAIVWLLQNRDARDRQRLDAMRIRFARQRKESTMPEPTADSVVLPTPLPNNPDQLTLEQLDELIKKREGLIARKRALEATQPNRYLTIIQSRRFQLTVAGIVVAVASKYLGVSLDETTVMEIVGLIGAYVVSHGLRPPEE